LPIGLAATDSFIMAIHEATGLPVPAELEWERGRLLDLMSDMEQYFHGTSVAMWGDPAQLVGLASLCSDVGMQVKYAVTGTPGKSFEKRMAAILGEDFGGGRIMQGNAADMYRLHTWIKQDAPDLIIGNSHGKHMARDEDLPFVRHGFPVLDRIGHQYFTTLGYRGGMRLCEQILNALLDRKDRDAPEEKFELVM
jgi:nitrogenase molybdenum-iron protein beta chain